MDGLEKIIEYYMSNTKEKEIERQQLLDSEIKNKTHEEVATYLTGIPPDEIGGLTAISGFYYQFLVTIEYILEMLEDKWDFVIMEHHDDIVVGKEKNIRFIQVKTSEKVKIDVTTSPASGLYSRGSIIHEKVAYKKNNSWVDKLISNAELALTSDGFTTEFQLYSSYHFMRTLNFNFDIYTDNKKYDKIIPINDDLLLKISKDVRDKDGNPYNFQDNCGEPINDLLSRFYIYSGISMSELETFRHDLCMKLNKWLFKDVGSNITMQVEDLHLLIGYLCEKCTYRNNPEILLITKNNIEHIFGEIRRKSIEGASIATNLHDSKKVADRIFEELLTEFEDSLHIKFIQDRLYTYKEYLLGWITAGGSTRQLVERYIDGTTWTPIYSKLSGPNREKKLQDLFCVVFMLIIARESHLQFAENNGLLSKQCNTTKQLFTFFSLEKQRKVSFSLQRLKDIVENYDTEESLFLMDKELHIVIQNYNDRDFNTSRNWEIHARDDREIQEFETESKLNKVPVTANVIPGDILRMDFLDALNKETDIRETLKEVWQIYEGRAN